MAIFSLGLDLGSSLGWATAHDGKIIDSGTVKLSHSGQPNGYRFSQFLEFLNSFDGLDEIVFEEIEHFGMTTKTGKKVTSRQAQLVYGGLKAFLEYYIYQLRIPNYSIHQMTLKKQFTGTGKATKEMICAKCHRLGWKGGRAGTDISDDEADAIAVLWCHYQNKSRDLRF